jgi:hypothetical protein
MVATDFILSYANLLKQAGLSPEKLRGVVKIEADKIIALLKHLLRGIHVDEAWYRKKYEDVDLAIKSGSYESAKHHFVEDGYFEGRQPGPVQVDEAWYLAAYPDVAESIELGDIASAQDHFDRHGYQEGRMPAAY